ncbi:hypothetical protein ACIQWR_39680 [Streptomyces sp. NPDC098789]|uniref:hypothetical protein n=1 Tax=Streptomyces sp. NPDC098789 TaxID=3366098 RepID=UPI00382EEC1D
MVEELRACREMLQQDASDANVSAAGNLVQNIQARISSGELRLKEAGDRSLRITSELNSLIRTIVARRSLLTLDSDVEDSDVLDGERLRGEGEIKRIRDQCEETFERNLREVSNKIDVYEAQSFNYASRGESTGSGIGALNEAALAREREALRVLERDRDKIIEIDVMAHLEEEKLKREMRNGLPPDVDSALSGLLGHPACNNVIGREDVRELLKLSASRGARHVIGSQVDHGQVIEQCMGDLVRTDAATGMLPVTTSTSNYLLYTVGVLRAASEHGFNIEHDDVRKVFVTIGGLVFQKINVSDAGGKADALY